MRDLALSGFATTGLACPLRDSSGDSRCSGVLVKATLRLEAARSSNRAGDKPGEGLLASLENLARLAAASWRRQDLQFGNQISKVTWCQLLIFRVQATTL